ncbi:unnamed protein product [Gadus morhua 'NCC']
MTLNHSRVQPERSYSNRGMGLSLVDKLGFSAPRLKTLRSCLRSDGWNWVDLLNVHSASVQRLIQDHG